MREQIQLRPKRLPVLSDLDYFFIGEVFNAVLIAALCILLMVPEAAAESQILKLRVFGVLAGEITVVAMFFSHCATFIMRFEARISQFFSDARGSTLVNLHGIVGTAQMRVLAGGHWLGQLLPRRVREELYEPSHHEIVEDWLDHRHRTGLVRVWLTLCLCVKILLNFALSCIHGLVANVYDVFTKG